MKCCFYFLFLVISIFSTNQASAERISICPEQRYSGSHTNTLVCGFNTVRGEEIITTTSTPRTGYFTNVYHLGAIINGGPLTLGGSQSVLRLITDNRIGYSEVRVKRYGAETLRVWVESNRTNLKIGAPEINQETGDMSLPHYVTTVTPFLPGSTSVTIKFNTYASNGTTSSNHTTIETRGLTNCVNSSRCFGIVRIPFLERKSIPRGHNWQYATINDQRAWAETTYDDNTFRWNGPVDDFFHEKIPNIMKNRGAGWEIGQINLDTWLNRRAQIKTPPAGFDWTIPVFYSVSTDWTLDRKNATDSRFILKHRELLDPSYFGGSNARAELADRVRKRFKANPSLQEFDLSRIPDFNISAVDYHKQHITHIIAQEGGISAAINFDPVTAAFGGFSYYLVPFGKAKREGNKYRITITGVRTHVMDSFDFNGFQSLGCWKQPNILQLTSSSGARCFTNGDFRRYRFIKVSGGDYNAITTPKYTALSTHISFLIAK